MSDYEEDRIRETMLMHPIQHIKWVRDMENPGGFQKKRDYFKQKHFQEKINHLSWIFKDI